MNSADRKLNYVTANRFYVEIGGSISAWFTECQGLSVTVDTEKISEGGVNDQQRILLKPAKFSDVTLKRGVTDDFTFWDWIGTVLSGGKARRNVNILVFNPSGETMQSWTLIGAIPVSWKAPSLSADSNAVAIEELTLTYEGLNVSKSNSGRDATKLLVRDGSGYFSSK
ncbi:conserved hypothetical phage tail protein [Cylindrospermum sp. NIES-4074]|nr:conserved hypothetical phage tail protein [Cylindrospermum sp. NIES-4074]